jgi:nucleotide-binding universal stress UspA family protein
MDIRSILVNLDIDPAASKVLTAAVGLARKFGAELIGLAADEPSLAMIGIDGGAAAVDFYAAERTEIETRLRAAGAAFHATVPPDVKSQWRAYVAGPTRSLVDAARCADLIVTGSSLAGAFGTAHMVDVGEVVLSAGRPVLAVADGITEVTSDKIVIGWKDTREARRAVADALPFLTEAKSVVAVTLSEGDPSGERASLDDLVGWLGRHGIEARGDVVDSGDGFIDVLESTARTYGADMLVAGGYGHSRLREWLLGGMTRDMIGATDITRLLSN